MAFVDRMASHAAPDLEAGESVRLAARGMVRGAYKVLAPVAGVLTGVGALIGASMTEGILGAAIGGGIGGGAGATIGSLVAVMTRSDPEYGNVINLAAVVADKRFLVYRRSSLTNRPGELVRRAALSSIRSATLGDAFAVFPRPVEVEVEDGSKIELEVMRIDKPDQLVAALQP